MSFLANRSIATKILVGFSSIMLLLVATDAIVELALTTIGGAFVDQRMRSAMVDASRDIDAAFRDLTQEVTLFTIDGAPQTQQAAEASLATLQSALRHADQLDHSNPDRTMRTAGMAAAVGGYAEGWHRAVAIKTDQIQLATSVLPRLAAQLRKSSLLLVTKITQVDKAELVPAASKTADLFIDARLAVDELLARRQPDDALKAANADIAGAIKRLTFLIDSLGDTAEAASAQQLLQGLKDYQAAYRKSADLLTQLDQAVGIDLPAKGAELSRLVSTLRQSAASQAAATDATTRALIDRLEQLLLIGAVAGIFVAIGISLVVSRSISVPLRRFATVMRRLAAHELDADIPDRRRRDEIGSMAQALEVFKAGMIEAERLNAAEKEARTAKERRHERMVTQIAAFDRLARSALGLVDGSATRLRGDAASLLDGASTLERQAGGVADITRQAAATVQTVTAAAEGLSASIVEIAAQTARSSDVAGKAALHVDVVTATVGALDNTSEQIAKFVDIIAAIAQQTNMLALNATIEAARAGDAGKGFTVVATEVKSLANQTRHTTDEIAKEVTAMRAAVDRVVEGIAGFARIIDSMREIATAVAASTEEQGSATKEIVRSMLKVSESTDGVLQAVLDVNQVIEETSASSRNVLASADELGSCTGTFGVQVEEFLRSMAAA